MTDIAGLSGRIKFASYCLIGSLCIFLSAKLNINLPGTDVPQSAQTLAILLLAALLPGFAGVTAVLIYLLLGILGIPVFSNGGSGLSHAFGPTGGYLIGFVLSALLITVLKSNASVWKPLNITLAMLSAHLIILFSGWLWLSTLIGISDAYFRGVEPFLIGGVVKSILAAVIVIYSLSAIREYKSRQ